ncbi:hypothetical protein [Nocardia salmonicida]
MTEPRHDLVGSARAPVLAAISAVCSVIAGVFRRPVMDYLPFP